MAGRIIRLSHLATQSDINNFSYLNFMTHRAFLRDSIRLLGRKIVASFQGQVTKGL